MDAEELTFTITLDKFNLGLKGKVFFKIIISPFAEVIVLN